MDTKNPVIDLADVYDYAAPVLPHVAMSLVIAFFTFVAVFGG